MPDQQLQELQAELETLRRKVAAYGTARRPGPPHRGPARGRGRLVATIALTLLVALVPLSMLAAGAFTDLDPASPHNANIEAIRQAGITKGCDPPDFTLYCPNDYVTRQEMASFLARTAGLGDNPPVANAQTAATVVDGAITPAKLSATGSTGGQVLTSTGAGVAWQNPPPAGVSYARTVIVGPVGSNADNGTALLNALAGINASADTPHLLKIEPGIYDLGATPLAMKPYVDIEGSGEGVTTITGNTATSNQVSTGTILGANNAELRFLTVANASVAQGLHTAAIYINGTSPHLTHITVRNSTNQGFVKHGITITGSQAKPLIQGVSISVITGGGGTEGIDISGAAAPPTASWSRAAARPRSGGASSAAARTPSASPMPSCGSTPAGCAAGPPPSRSSTPPRASPPRCSTGPRRSARAARSPSPAPSPTTRTSPR